MKGQGIANRPRHKKEEAAQSCEEHDAKQMLRLPVAQEQESIADPGSKKHQRRFGPEKSAKTRRQSGRGNKKAEVLGPIAFPSPPGRGKE